MEEGGHKLGAQQLHQVLCQHHVTLHPPCCVRLRNQQKCIAPMSVLHDLLNRGEVTDLHVRPRKATPPPPPTSSCGA